MSDGFLPPDYLVNRLEWTTEVVAIYVTVGYWLIASLDMRRYV